MQPFIYCASASRVIFGSGSVGRAPDEIDRLAAKRHGTWDVIFCRNVLIYFDQPTKIDVFGRMQKISEQDGYLFLGAAETVIGLTDAYRAAPDLRGVYMPNTVRTASPSLAPGLGSLAQKTVAR